MRFNPYSKLKEIEERLKEVEGDAFEVEFSDGLTVVMSQRRVGEMFDSVTNGGTPNKDAVYFLNKLDSGIEDEGGLCHLLKAMTIDPVELWSD